MLANPLIILSMITFDGHHGPQRAHYVPHPDFTWVLQNIDIKRLKDKIDLLNFDGRYY
jgi:hypothetical protein